MYQKLSREQLQALASQAEAYMDTLPDNDGIHTTYRVMRIESLEEFEREAYAIEFHASNAQGDFFPVFVFVRDIMGQLTTANRHIYFSSDWQTGEK